jgi:lincosamide nucleotidyltransferase A/C/D/E
VATSQNDVLWMLDVMARLGVSPVVAGGWGIDALVGHQTREHRDLDVLVPDPFVDALVDALVAESFSIATDWLPVRVEMTDASNDRHIDIHPAFDDGRQGWWQHGFDGERFESPRQALTDGIIGRRAVRCFTAAKQLELHQGYSPRPEDLLDIAVLHRLNEGRAMSR